MALQKQLIPPFRYAIVEDSFFRGAYPTIKNFRFLRRLHLKTIVSLTPEARPNRDIREFCEHEGITTHNFFVDKFQDGVTLTNMKVIQVLQIIIRPENLPVYLHCLDGTHITGLVVMCCRKLQSWNLSTSIAEFCQFEKDGEISREESQFVESFRGEIEIPPIIPKWLWQGVRTVKHPTFRLRFLPPIIPDQKEEEGSVISTSTRHSDISNTISKPRYHPSGGIDLTASRDSGADSLLKHPGVSGPGTANELTPLSGLTPLGGGSGPEGGVIYGDAGSGGRGQFGKFGMNLTMNVAHGRDEGSSNRGVVVYKFPRMIALDRNERWSGAANIGFPRQGIRELHDNERCRNLEALALEGLDVVGPRRLPGWPRQARRPQSMISAPNGKALPLRETELQQSITRR